MTGKLGASSTKTILSMTNTPDDIDTLKRLLQQALQQNQVFDTRNQVLELELPALKSELSEVA
ncbi:hypothetical protein TUM4438_41710 [Shewanella sairae]|uniref:Uncharacterized protein n=1 Tax=Shewanella sairae TaxID=190310 RepID=A0ABQ4PQR0_9GAMM|nr:hypothetical protein TUM4438_41710 [Shewanella sairae]